MIIIWGVREYFRTNKVTQRGVCSNCNQLTTLKSYHARRFFHLYYVPVIPLQRRMRYHQMCDSCGHGSQFDLELFESLLQAFRIRSADAVLALLENEKYIDAEDEATRVEAVPFLLDAMNWVYAAGDLEFYNGVAEKLRGAENKYPALMLQAGHEIRQGKINEAIVTLRAAMQADPDQLLAIVMRGELLVHTKQFEAALESYSDFLKLTEDSTQQVACLLAIAHCEITLKRYDAACQTFDRLLALQPSLAQDTNFMKSVKNARKKAGKK